MAKKVICGLVLVFMTATGAFAQSKWYNSYSPSIEKSKALVNAGIGFGNIGAGRSMGIPEITASVDFKLKKIPITIGGMGAFRTSSYPIVGYDDALTYTNIGFGVRGMYHFNFAKKLDTYAGMTLGYVIDKASGAGSSIFSGVSFFLWGFDIGGRYFFTNRMGVYFELGVNFLHIGSAGLTFKL